MEKAKKEIIHPIVQKVVPIERAKVQPIIQSQIKPIFEGEIYQINKSRIQPQIQRQIQPVVKRFIPQEIPRENQPMILADQQIVQKEMNIIKNEEKEDVDEAEEQNYENEIIKDIIYFSYSFN